MVEAYVKQEIQNGIATIEFFHPEQNSMPSSLLAKLAEVITNAGDNSAIKVIVLQSGGDRTFCAGASFKELITIDDSETGKLFFQALPMLLMPCESALSLLLVEFKARL